MVLYCLQPHPSLALDGWEGSLAVCDEKFDVYCFFESKSLNKPPIHLLSPKTIDLRASGYKVIVYLVESLQAVETLQWENILTVGSSSNSGNHSTNSGNPLASYSKQRGCYKRVPPENNEFEGEIIPCSDFRLGTSQPCG
ncbi:hypothetical protein Tco_0702184 [Tanacetum coccineum]|uniref:Uncharacterized protein n=1 Tax=Tanacetum coccineum TaxID=301880 RepID=A0ABQ4XV73_9ASTR